MPQRQSHHPDNGLIDRAEDGGVPAQSSSAGGNVARRVGTRAELDQAGGGDPEVTRVRKRDEGKREPRSKTNRQ